MLNIFLNALLTGGAWSGVWISLGLGVVETIAAIVISRALFGKISN